MGTPSDSSYLNMPVEEQSFRNLVNFYRDELMMIDGGVSISIALPERISRKPLYKYGIIVHVTDNNNSNGLFNGSRVRVTDEAKRILEDK